MPHRPSPGRGGTRERSPGIPKPTRTHGTRGQSSIRLTWTADTRRHVRLAPFARHPGSVPSDRPTAPRQNGLRATWRRIIATNLRFTSYENCNIGNIGVDKSSPHGYCNPRACSGSTGTRSRKLRSILSVTGRLRLSVLPKRRGGMAYLGSSVATAYARDAAPDVASRSTSGRCRHAAAGSETAEIGQVQVHREPWHVPESRFQRLPTTDADHVSQRLTVHARQPSEPKCSLKRFRMIARGPATRLKLAEIGYPVRGFARRSAASNPSTIRFQRPCSRPPRCAASRYAQDRDRRRLGCGTMRHSPPGRSRNSSKKPWSDASTPSA